MYDSISIDENPDEHYKQLFCSNEYLTYEKDSIIKINLTHRIHLIILCLLILTSQSNALPILQVNSNFIEKLSTTTYSVPIVPYIKYSESDHYKVYHPSYINNAPVQIYDPTNYNNQQQQLKRERYRRTMIDRMYLIFDEDADGQLSKDELYSLSLRLNIFPKYHYFLKKNSS